MYKIISLLAKIFHLLIISVNCFSQTETFDIITYHPPKDWKKDLKEGAVNYTNLNTTAGTFCVITMYASTESVGDAQKNFNNEWTNLVVTPYKAEANPKTETQTTADGWEAVTGASQVNVDGNDIYIMLTVISGFGKSVSIRSSLNDQSYTTQIDALFETMELAKIPGPAPDNNNTRTFIQSTVGTGKFRLMTYTAPAGWSEQQFSDGVVFKPLDLPAGEQLAIQIMEPLNATGSLEQALAQSFDEATAMYKATSMYQAGGKYGKKASQKSFNGWEYIRGLGGIQIGGNEQGLEVFVVQVNNRFERVAVLESRKYCGGVSRYYSTDRVNYRTDIENLLFSLQFSDFNGKVLRSGVAKGSGIIGLWQGTIQGTGAATGLNLEVFSPVFFTNGQVYFGPKFPTEGLDGLNSRVPPELYPRNWGTYTFSNGSGILKLPFADIPIRTEGNKLIVTKNQRDWPLYKLNDVDGARFSGTYRMSESYGIIPVISFTADGQFTDNGAIRVLYHQGSDCANPGFKPGSGSYEVRNYSIMFNYSDGRKIKIAFLGTEYEKNNPSPPKLRMSYNEDPLIRQ